jgi:putative heme iron utilization protein
VSASKRLLMPITEQFHKKKAFEINFFNKNGENLFVVFFSGTEQSQTKALSLCTVFTASSAQEA